MSRNEPPRSTALAGLVMAEVDALRLADGNHLQLTAMALGDTFHAHLFRVLARRSFIRAVQSVEVLGLSSRSVRAAI